MCLIGKLKHTPQTLNIELNFFANFQKTLLELKNENNIVARNSLKNYFH